MSAKSIVRVVAVVAGCTLMTTVVGLVYASGSGGVGINCDVESGTIGWSGEYVYPTTGGTVLVCPVSPEDALSIDFLKGTLWDADASAIDIRFLKRDVTVPGSTTLICTHTTSTNSAVWASFAETCTAEVINKSVYVYWVEIEFGASSSVQRILNYAIATD